MISVSTTFEWPEPLPISDRERRILNPPPKPPMLQWARDDFVLPKKTSKISGAWSDEYTPFIRRILELLERPPVSVAIRACTQGLKTTVVQILLAYICAVDPGPTGIVMPTELDAKERMRTKLKPLFAANPVLFEKIGYNVDTLNVGGATDLGDMLLYLMWASSASVLADKSIQNMIYDEVGKFVWTLLTGEHPIELGRKRQRTYMDIMRELIVSSPQRAGDIFDCEANSGTDEAWYTPCMKCGRWHELKTHIDTKGDAYIIIDTDPNGRYLHRSDYTSGKHARYLCPHCKNAWSASQRWRSNKAGLWVPSGQTMDPNGKVTGEIKKHDKFSFNVHAMMLWPEFAPVGFLASEFVKAMGDLKKGNKKTLMDFCLNQQAKSWKEEVKVIGSNRPREKKNDYPAGVVPNDVKVLVAGADFHKSQTGQVRVDWLVKGFADDLKSYVIAFGRAGSLEAMFRATSTQSFPWADPEAAEADGRPELMIRRGFIDAGYQPDDPEQGVYDEVYQFCKRYWRRMRLWWPIRGGKPNQVERFSDSNLERVVEKAQKKYRRKTARQYKGMILLTLAVVQFKDMLADWIDAPIDAPASESFAYDLPDEFFDEMVNEYMGKNDKGKWGWWKKEQHLETHGWDTDVYATAAGIHVGVEDLLSEAEQKKIDDAISMRGIHKKKIRISEKPRRRR